MKNILLFLCLSSLAFGAADDPRIIQRNPANNGDAMYTQPMPPSGEDGVYVWEGVTNFGSPRGKTYRLGSKFTLTGGFLVPHIQYSDLEGTVPFDSLGAAATAQAFSIQRANHTGTQTASTISDFSAASLAAVTWSTLTGKPTFASVATSGAYADLTGLPTIPTHNNQLTNGNAFVNQAGARGALTLTTTGSGSASYNNTSGVLNIPVGGSGTVTSVAAGTGLSGGTITTTGTISLPNTGTAGNYSGVTTDAQGRVTAGTNASYATPTFASSTSATQLSTTREAWVQYAYLGTANISLLAGQAINVFLEYADNAGMTTNLVLVDYDNIGNSGVLGLTTSNGLKVNGFIPAGKYRRVRFTSTGSPTLPSTIQAGQESLR